MLLVVGLTRRADAACFNGSASDCNPVGLTLHPGAAFVDADPPPGYDQCAGFINTALDDVGNTWENNCIPFNGGDLWLRVFDDITGELLLGAHLFDPQPCPWGTGEVLGYDSDTHEGAGVLAQPGACAGAEGTTFGWFAGAASFCGCSTAVGTANCNDVFTANATNDALLYASGDSTDHAYEAFFAPGFAKNTCPDFGEGEQTALRVAIYAPALDLDEDADGLLDDADNCDDLANPEQQDGDGDGTGDGCDNCEGLANADQADADRDGIGDLCDDCSAVFDPEQQDGDGDGRGDVCDNCPDVGNPLQEESDFDGIGDACDPCASSPDHRDGDGDGACDVEDNCPGDANADQADGDRDGVGDACEPASTSASSSDGDGDDGDGSGSTGTTSGDPEGEPQSETGVVTTDPTDAASETRGADTTSTGGHAANANDHAGCGCGSSGSRTWWTGVVVIFVRRRRSVRSGPTRSRP